MFKQPPNSYKPSLKEVSNPIQQSYVQLNERIKSHRKVGSFNFLKQPYNSQNYDMKQSLSQNFTNNFMTRTSPVNQIKDEVPNRHTVKPSKSFIRQISPTNNPILLTKNRSSNTSGGKSFLYSSGYNNDTTFNKTRASKDL